MWCVAELDDEYIAKMEDVLALYEKPYRSAEPVICLDERPVSLHGDVRPYRPARPGHVITTISAAEPPTSSLSWNPRPDGTLPALPPTARRLSSLEWSRAW